MNEQDEMIVGPVDIDVIEVRVLESFRIWVRFNDGEQGEIDLAEYAEKSWFQPWEERTVFESVHISSHDALIWGDDPDESDMAVCILSLYMELTGKSWEDLDRRTSLQSANA